MYKTINQEWITDRVPTEADSDVHGYVWVPSNGLDGFNVTEYDDISLGEPWMHCPKAPPYVKQKEYWCKPSDLPSVCWIMSKDNPCCILVTLTKTVYFLSNSGRSIYYGDYLKDFRWSDRPFDNFEGGKECIKFRDK